LRASDRDRAIALSGEHFTHIEQRLAQGIVERSERGLEDVLRPVFEGAEEVGKRPRKSRRQATVPAS